MLNKPSNIMPHLRKFAMDTLPTIVNQQKTFTQGATLAQAIAQGALGEGSPLPTSTKTLHRDS